MRPILIGLFLVFDISSARGDEPAEKLPLPRLLAPARPIAPAPGGNLFLPPPPPISYQHGTRDVWQNFAVDATGRWRPRVILAPFGSYYHATGQPFPWTTTHPRAFRPVTHD